MAACSSNASSTSLTGPTWNHTFETTSDLLSFVGVSESETQSSHAARSESAASSVAQSAEKKRTADQTVGGMPNASITRSRAVAGQSHPTARRRGALVALVVRAAPRRARRCAVWVRSELHRQSFVACAKVDSPLDVVALQGQRLSEPPPHIREPRAADGSPARAHAARRVSFGSQVKVRCAQVVVAAQQVIAAVGDPLTKVRHARALPAPRILSPNDDGKCVRHGRENPSKTAVTGTQN